MCGCRNTTSTDFLQPCRDYPFCQLRNDGLRNLAGTIPSEPESYEKHLERKAIAERAKREAEASIKRITGRLNPEVVRMAKERDRSLDDEPVDQWAKRLVDQIDPRSYWD